MVRIDPGATGDDDYVLDTNQGPKTNAQVRADIKKVFAENNNKPSQPEPGDSQQ